MVHAILPAYCRRHGLIPVPSPIGGGASYVLRQVSVNCPRCPQGAAPAQILDGDYDQASRVYNILLSGLSSEQIDAVRAIFVQLQRDEITPQRARKEVKKVAPRALGLFDWFGGLSEQSQVQVFCTVVLAVTGLIGALGGAYIMRPTPPAAVAAPIATETARKDEADAIEKAVRETLRPRPRPKAPK
jgi:hypothetical protein